MPHTIPASTPPGMPDALVCHYWHGETPRSRSIGDTIITGMVDIPPPPSRLRADWARELAHHMDLEAGDVDSLPLARARTRWPEYASCVRAAADWTARVGLPGVLTGSDVALMVCRGARYHHDGEQYGGMAFCNLFLSEDSEQDVHFPWLDLRVPLRRGTLLVFDTCQPHAVIPRGASRFAARDFTADRDNTQVFLTWELPIEDPRVAQALHIAVDAVPPGAPLPDDGQLRQRGRRVSVHPETAQLVLS
ncbi:hypothetical protein [Cupriavidus plantarum]|uniref:hypothetical protein n=1 Tax=Cupriavidus plantarum TaxID=942865 RepID=UPI000F1364E3|nr:hypothetical protein [Cupriavidus plantarum]RLK33396.1 hypothetical protein C7417_4043 [Cupriavidus plantarum]